MTSYISQHFVALAIPSLIDWRGLAKFGGGSQFFFFFGGGGGRGRAGATFRIYQLPQYFDVTFFEGGSLVSLQLNAFLSRVGSDTAKYLMTATKKEK